CGNAAIPSTTSSSAPPTSRSTTPTSSRTTATRTRSISRTRTGRSKPKPHGRHSCITARFLTGCSDPSRARKHISRTANTGGKHMTTHETQPVDTVEPNTTQTSERVADTPLETVDETGNLEAQVQTADSTVSADTSNELFGDHELSQFHSRWTEVQAAFVDDPRD